MRRLPYKRSVRVGDFIRQEVADIIMHKIKHKTLGFVTVTGAKLSSDLRSATIYLSVLKDEEKVKTVRKINESKQFIRGELAKRLTMKFVPTLTFMIDEAVEYGRKIDNMLNNLDAEGGPVDDDEDLF